jgi:hypothetical protein
VIQEYDVLVQGDWHRNPRRFVGAVIAMHEYMQDRTCRLLVDCFEIFDRWIETTVSRLELAVLTELDPIFV